MTFRFVEEHRDQWPVRVLCQTLGAALAVAEDHDEGHAQLGYAILDAALDGRTRPLEPLQNRFFGIG